MAFAYNLAAVHAASESAGDGAAGLPMRVRSMVSDATIRRFRWQDLPEFTRVFNETSGLASSEKAWDAEYMGQFLSQPSRDAEENCYLAEAEGSVVGFALVCPELPVRRVVAIGGVLTPHRNKGVERRLLSETLDRARALEARVVHVQADPDDGPALHVLETEGFRPVRRYWQMRWEGRATPTLGLPPRFSLRRFRLGHDERALAELQNAAFSLSWGFCPNTVEEISARVRLKRCDPDGIIFVVHGSRLAAYNWTLRASNEVGSIGWIAMTGVHPAYRGQGLGRAAAVAGMEYLKAKGVDGIELEVDGANVHARGLYLKLGFTDLRHTVWCEKRLE